MRGAAGPDGAEGIAAFLDKRRPTFGADLPRPGRE